MEMNFVKLPGWVNDAVKQPHMHTDRVFIAAGSHCCGNVGRQQHALQGNRETIQEHLTGELCLSFTSTFFCDF